MLRARQQPARNPIDAAEKFPKKSKNKETGEKANTIFNEVWQFAYVLGVREREILLIQQSIQANTEGYFSGIFRNFRRYNS